MKKILLTLTFCGLTFIGNSQGAGVEQLTYGIQTGVLGVWVYNELKILNQIALRSEIGLDSEIFGGSFYGGVGFLMTPVITLEPRWYYNLNKRASKAKSIIGNSGNFLSLKSSYNPDWFVMSNYDNLKVINQISIFPTWGLKRTVGNHFTHEAGIGIGYRYYFAKSAGYINNEGEVDVNIHLRVGYLF
jgi:hypothetical protein